MKSPFAIIRKHQKVMMVITIGLCMFAFIFLGTIQNTGGQGLVPIIGLMMGAGIFWVLGNQAGKTGSYTILGAVLGLVIGLWLPQIGQSSAEVATTIGDFTPRELHELVRKRQAANKFMAEAYRTTHKFPDDPNTARFFAQIWQMGMQRTQFILVSPDDRQDVIMGHILRYEAEQMGITVTDDLVIKHIQDTTKPNGLFGDKRGALTKAEFRDIRKRIGITETDLFEALRNELQAQIAMNLLAPRTARSPEQSWQDYRKVNVTNSVEVAAVNVEQFAAELTEPSESELKAFFEQHKENFPGQSGPAAPGFRQPRKVQLAFLEADYETVEADVPEPNEDEIVAYYQENKETLYRINTLPDDFPNTPSKTTDDKTEATDDGKSDGPKLLDPNDGKKDSSDDSDSKKDDATKTDDAKSSDDAAAPKKESGDASEKSDSKPKSQPSTEDKSSTKKKADDDAQAAIERPGEFLASADDVNNAVALLAQDEKKKDTTPSNDTKNKKETPKADAPKAQADKSETPKSDDGEPNKDAETKKSDPANKETTAPEKKDDEKGDDKDGKNAAPPFPDLLDSDDAPPPPLPEPKVVKPSYRPLAEVKDEIRDDLLRQKTGELMQQKSAKAMAEMRELGLFVNAVDESEKLSPETASQRLQEYAKKNGLRYVETKLLSYDDLNSEDYPIGNSVEPIDDPFGAQNSEAVADEIFRSENTQMYTPQESHDRFGTDNRFVWWVINDEKAHEPTFDESGVSEQVMEQYKTFHGRPKAEERAKALAEIVRAALKDKKLMSDALADQTVTGSKDGLQLSVLATPPFSWYTLSMSSAPSLNPLQQNQPTLRLSTIPGVEKVGGKFMEAVSNLEVDEVAVIPNFDLSTFYVVRLMERDPGNEAMTTVMQTKFLNEGPSSSGNRQLASDSERLVSTDWYQEIQQKYDIRWNQSFQE